MKRTSTAKEKAPSHDPPSSNQDDAAAANGASSTKRSSVKDLSKRASTLADPTAAAPPPSAENPSGKRGSVQDAGKKGSQGQLEASEATDKRASTIAQSQDVALDKQGSNRPVQVQRKGTTSVTVAAPTELKRTQTTKSVGDGKDQDPHNNKSGSRSSVTTVNVSPQRKSVSVPAPAQSANSRKSVKRRSRKKTDVDLTRKSTVEVVCKYELGQPELRKFRQCFNQIDLDQSGMIDYDEFFEFIDEVKTPFSEGLFRMIDADQSGTIDFEEFVHAMVLYCMYTRDEILQFAFDTFDVSHSGALGEREFKKLVALVNDGKPAFPANFKTALQEFDKNKDGVIDFEEFKLINKRYPMLLFPCFRLQDRMQKSTLGEKHWHILQQRLYNRLKIESYQRKHNGALPPMSFMETVLRFFGFGSYDVYQP